MTTLIRPRTARKEAVQLPITPGVACPATNAGFGYRVTYHQGRSQLRVKRYRRTPDTRSERHRGLQEVLTSLKMLPEARMSVVGYERDGRVEHAYRITFKKVAAAGDEGFQKKITDILIEFAGEHETGKSWATRWRPALGLLELFLKQPLKNNIAHPIWSDYTTIGDGDRLHIPFATGEGDQVAYWNISHKSTGPHCLINGPTGGGKTTTIRSIIVECVMRGIPVIGVDPKEIELDGMDDFPGVVSVITDPLAAARLARALYDEVRARNAYMRQKKLNPEDMPLLVAIFDEFFILSAAWKQLEQDPETKDLMKALKPLSAIAQIAALARSSGVRLCVGVQRPDAAIFGGDAGSVRDNFKTRVSQSSLSQDGALMMWGDAQIGRHLDASVPGRAMVTDPSGKPVQVQSWWTPNVDPHPTRREALSPADRAMVEALTPSVEPEVDCYSPALSELLLIERARKVNPEPVPEPVRIGGVAVAEFDDGFPASGVEVGTHVLIPIDDNPDSPMVVGVVVDIRHKKDKQHTVVATELSVEYQPAGATRPIVSTHRFEAGESIFLADVDSDELAMA